MISPLARARRRRLKLITSSKTQVDENNSEELDGCWEKDDAIARIMGDKALFSVSATCIPEARLTSLNYCSRLLIVETSKRFRCFH